MFAKWAKQTTDALAWIHSKGVVHADVKPANLLLTSTLDLRLSDFGSSLLVHPHHPPVDGVGLGTLPFSAPELVDPNRSFSFPVDIFALGASLYQCLTGREPYKGLRTMEMLHHVRKGGLWAYEERRGPKEGDSLDISPFPSAWREEPLRRGGSLRVRPRISRMPSAESLRASDDIVAATGEASGVKLWAKWANHAPADGTAADMVSALLAEDGPITPVDTAPFTTPDVASPATPVSGKFRERQTYLGPEPDGELVEVDQKVLDILREMLSPDEAERPTADELQEMW
jgi:serine/threonine protein kinase